MAMTKLKRLNVIILKGKVIFFRSGFTMRFSAPNNMPAKVKVAKKSGISEVLVGKIKKGPAKWTPEMNFCEIQSPKIAEMIWMSKFHTKTMISEKSL
jgi:hypothetical protein